MWSLQSIWQSDFDKIFVGSVSNIEPRVWSLVSNIASPQEFQSLINFPNCWSKSVKYLITLSMELNKRFTFLHSDVALITIYIKRQFYWRYEQHLWMWCLQLISTLLSKQKFLGTTQLCSWNFFKPWHPGTYLLDWVCFTDIHTASRLDIWVGLCLRHDRLKIWNKKNMYNKCGPSPPEDCNLVYYSHSRTRSGEDPGSTLSCLVSCEARGGSSINCLVSGLWWGQRLIQDQLSRVLSLIRSKQIYIQQGFYKVQ